MTPSRRSPFARLALLALAASALALPACTLGERGSRRPRPYNPREGARPLAAKPAPAPLAPPKVEAPEKIAGSPSVLVMWQALAGEQEKFRNRRIRDASNQGSPDVPILIVNASFSPTPEQVGIVRAQSTKGAVARVPDAVMNEFLRQVQASGFYDHARPTAAVAPYFASERARGRITIERDGKSVTLVSQYGLGLAAETRAIPGIYAELKLSIQLLKNTTPTVGVSGSTDRVDLERAKKGEPPEEPLHPVR